MSRIPDLLRERYGAAADALPAMPAVGPVFEQLLGHRSVRAYGDAPLRAGTLEALIAAAQSAATSSNLQAWSVVAVEDAARRQRLSMLARDQAHVRKAPLFLVWIADLSRLDRNGERAGIAAQANRYLEMFLVAAIDAALAAQNAVLAAETLGLGTVYIGALRSHAAEVAAELALPPNAFPLFGLCVGHPDPAVPAAIKPRLAQSVVLHRETYAVAGEAAAVAAYDDTLQAFQRTQSMPPTPWSRQAAQRVAGAESLAGRDRLASVLAGLGAGLA